MQEETAAVSFKFSRAAAGPNGKRLTWQFDSVKLQKVIKEIYRKLLAASGMIKAISRIDVGRLKGPQGNCPVVGWQTHIGGSIKIKKESGA